MGEAVRLARADVETSDVDVAVLVLDRGEVGHQVGAALLGGFLACALRLGLFFPLVDGVEEFVIQVLRGREGVSDDPCVEPGLEVVELLESLRVPVDVIGRPRVIVDDDEGEQRLVGFHRP